MAGTTAQNLDLSPRPKDLSRSDRRWVQQRCSRKGHLIAFVDDEVATELTGTGPDGTLLRCLRCGDFTEADGPHQTLIGSQQSPAPLEQLPLVLRGAHGR